MQYSETIQESNVNTKEIIFSGRTKFNKTSPNLFFFICEIAASYQMGKTDTTFYADIKSDDLRGLDRSGKDAQSKINNFSFYHFLMVSRRDRLEC